MTKARARAADDEGDDLSCPSDPVLACLGPVRPAPRELHCSPAAADGTPACKPFAAGKGVQGGLRVRARPPVAAPAVLDVREVRGVPRDVLREKDPDATPCWFPHTPSRGFRRREAGEAAAPRPAVRGRRRPSRRAVPGPAGRRRGRGRGSAELGTSRGLPRLRAQRAGRATRKEGSFVGQRRFAQRGRGDSRRMAREGALPRPRSPAARWRLVEGVASADTHGAGSISVAGDSRESMLRAVNAAVPELLRGVAAGRARGALTPRETKRENFFTKKNARQGSVFPSVGRAGDARGARTLRRRRAVVRAHSKARDARAGRGVPQKPGDTHAWPAEAAAAGAPAGEDDAEGARERERDAPLSSDWKRVSDVVHDVVQDERARTPDSTVLP